MAEVKWIKITTDMFDNRKIKHLRRLPDGNSIVLIWIMLLTMAGRCNSSGMIFLTENIPYTPKMLADELDFEESTVRLALEALERFGMIVATEEYFAIAGWSEHQNTDGLEKIKAQNRLRKQRQRERAAALPEPEEDVSRSCHVTSRDSHATDIDKDKDKDKETENKKSKKERPQSGYDAILAAVDDESLREMFLEYIKMRKMIKSPMTDRALQMLVNKVYELEPYDEDRQKALLEQAILNNWKSVYPLKDQAKPQQQTATDDFMARLKSLHSTGGA